MDLQDRMNNFHAHPFLEELVWIEEQSYRVKDGSFIILQEKELWSTGWIPGQSFFLKGSVVRWIYNTFGEDKARTTALFLLKNIRNKLGLFDPECKEDKVEYYMNKYDSLSGTPFFKLQLIHYLVMNLEKPENVRVKNVNWNPDGEIEIGTRNGTLLPFKNEIPFLLADIREKVDLGYTKRMNDILGCLIREVPNFKEGYGHILLLSPADIQDVKVRLKFDGFFRSSSVYKKVKGTPEEWYFEGIRNELGITDEMEEKEVENLLINYKYGCSLVEIHKKICLLKHPEKVKDGRDRFLGLIAFDNENYLLLSEIRTKLGIEPSPPETKRKREDEPQEEKRKKVDIKTEDGKPFISYFENEKGEKDGLYLEYWPHTDIVRLKVEFKEDKKHGSFVGRYPNGKVKIKTNFKEDKFDGDLFEYSPLGSLVEFSQQEEGLYHGIFRTFSKDKDESRFYIYGKPKKDGEVDLCI